MTMFRSLAASASLLALAACATVGPNYHPPKADAVATRALAVDDAAGAGAEEPAADWWRAMNDETLNALIAAAFAENRDLRVAVANVEAARAAANLTRTNLRPTGQAGADYQRRRLSGSSFGIDGAPFDDTNYYRGAASASWELDFFGRVRRSAEAARADAEAADFLRRDAESLVAAETARAYIDYRGAEVRLRVAERNLEVQNKTLDLVKVRLDEGLGSKLDVARAEAQAKTTEAEVPTFEAAKAAAANRLATLTGASLEDVTAKLGATDKSMPEAPTTIAVGDAARLIVRRADVRSAERRLAAATARIGVAKADYFPRISLLGNVAVSAQTLAGVGAGGAVGYGVGPTLTWSGFDIPRVRAAVKQAGAGAEAAFAAYEQSIFRAVEETQTTLSNFGRERVRYEALAAASADAREATSLAHDRFKEGADDFIDVLDAEQRQLTAEAALAEAQVALSADYIAVYRALGAGWSEAGRTRYVKRLAARN